MPELPIPLAISRFAALPLPEKVSALCAAAVRVEQSLEKHGRKLGHPADWPTDYLSKVGMELLGLTVDHCDDQTAPFAAARYPVANFLRRAGVSISGAEARLAGAFNELVLASATPENQFAAIIGVHELNPQRPSRLAKPWALHQHAPFGKLLQASKTYRRVFLGVVSFVDARGADRHYTDQSFAAYCHAQQQFRYEAADIVAYAAGIEFPC